MPSEPFYDPAKSYLDNFERGPFGLFANTTPASQITQPKHQFLGHPVYAPLGIPAGPLINGRFVKAALDMGFDIPVYKTVRTKKYACHPWPNVLAVKVEGDLAPDRTLVANEDYSEPLSITNSFGVPSYDPWPNVLAVKVEGDLAPDRTLVANEDYSEPLSITNSFGVPSYDPEFWQRDMADAAVYARPGQVVVGSFQGTLPENGRVADYLADFVLGARLVKETGVPVIEVNLSCPNEGTANLLCFDIARSRQVVEAIKDEIGSVPLVIKMAFYKDEKKLEEFLREVGKTVDGIAAINTISAEILDEDGKQALPGEGRLRSGVCGSSVKWAGVAMASKLARIRGELGQKFTIVGVGGAGSAEAFDEYRRAGADVVMSATAAMWHPELAKEIKEQAHEL